MSNCIHVPAKNPSAGRKTSRKPSLNFVIHSKTTAFTAFPEFPTRPVNQTPRHLQLPLFSREKIPTRLQNLPVFPRPSANCVSMLVNLRQMLGPCLVAGCGPGTQSLSVTAVATAWPYSHICSIERPFQSGRAPCGGASIRGNDLCPGIGWLVHVRRLTTARQSRSLFGTRSPSRAGKPACDICGPVAGRAYRGRLR